MVRSIIIPFVFLCTIPAIGQSGIRGTILDFGTVTKKFNPNILIGYDRDITDRTSFGIDLIKSFSFNPEGTTDEIITGTSSTYYSILANSWGLQYRSQFFFSGSGYIGTTVGFRSISLKIAGSTTSYSSYNYTSAPFSRTASTTTFPIGLRLGFRSELDGYYGDIYAGVGYNVGGNVNAVTDALTSTDVLSKLWLNVGYVLGIGW